MRFYSIAGCIFNIFNFVFSQWLFKQNWFQYWPCIHILPNIPAEAPNLSRDYFRLSTYTPLLCVKSDRIYTNIHQYYVKFYLYLFELCDFNFSTQFVVLACPANDERSMCDIAYVVPNIKGRVLIISLLLYNKCDVFYLATFYQLLFFYTAYILRLFYFCHK